MVLPGCQHRGLRQKKLQCHPAIKYNLARSLPAKHCWSQSNMYKSSFPLDYPVTSTPDVYCVPCDAPTTTWDFLDCISCLISAWSYTPHQPSSLHCLKQDCFRVGSGLNSRLQILSSVLPWQHMLGYKGLPNVSTFLWKMTAISVLVQCNMYSERDCKRLQL